MLEFRNLWGKERNKEKGKRENEIKEKK